MNGTTFQGGNIQHQQIFSNQPRDGLSRVTALVNEPQNPNNISFLDNLKFNGANAGSGGGMQSSSRLSSLIQ